MRRVLVSLTLLSLAACASKQSSTTTTAEAPKPPPMPAPDGSRTLVGTPEAFTTACTQELERARTTITALEKLNPADGEKVLETFDTAVAALSNAGARASVARNSHPDAAMRSAADTCEQEVEKLNTEISLNRGVYDVLAKVDVSTADGATRTWVERTLRDLRRAGVDRDEATRAKVKALNEELTLLGQQFGQHIREDVRFVELDPAQLDGLPDDYKKAHPPGPNGKVKITSDYPDYVPFLAYAKDAKAREALWRVYRMRGHPKNLETLPKLIAKRHELATLLGYPNWAAYVTETKMVKSEQNAANFIDQVNKAAESAAKREYQELLALKKRDDPAATALNPWDQDYYEDKLKAERFGFNSQDVRPYLEYGRVLDGILDVTSTMFGIRYERVADAASWHADVRTYDIKDTAGALLGRIHLDMHPRADKYKHAAQFDLVVGQHGKAYPEGVLMCNFPKPGTEPALMQPREVETFFHEFGHLLHHILGGKQRWAAQSGVRTEWDFVETPSMMLQQWAVNNSVLERFAKHHQTGEAIPAELVKKMVAAQEFGKGLFTRRQMYLAAVSLNYYNRAPGFDVNQVAAELQPQFEPFRKEIVDGTYFPLSFGHLDGYSAIYYTYIWSSVIARDLLTVFEKEGYLNPDPAQRYRKAVLEPGGSKDAALLVKDFLGREYNFQAYEAWLNAAP